MSAGKSKQSKQSKRSKQLKQGRKQAGKEKTGAQVKLKDFFGIRPEVYLVYLYTFLLILLFLSIILLPGLLKNGSQLEIWTNVEGAEFFIDGQRIGFLPGTYFIRRGQQEMIVRREGFEPYREEIMVGGRLLFSLFFPRRETIRIELRPDTSLSSLEFRKPVLLDMAAWGFHPASARRQVPPLFDGYAISALSRADGELSGLSTVAFTLIGNDQQLRDILRGLSRLYSASLVPNASGLTALIGEVASQNRLPEEYLADILPASTYLEKLRGILEVESDESATGSSGRLPDPATASAIIATLRNLGYTGSLRAEGGGLIMSSPVNYGLFQRFLAEQDVWSEDGFLALEAAGLTSANYFMQDPLGRKINSRPEEPVRGINALSAFAFMDWLGQHLNDLNGLSDLNIRLPHPGELIPDDLSRPAGDAAFWEYTGQYAQIHQSATSAALTIEAGEMRSLQEKLLAGEGREARYQIFLAAGIRVQNSSAEIGTLMPTMVSPLAGFRLVFEEQ